MFFRIKQLYTLVTFSGGANSSRELTGHSSLGIGPVSRKGVCVCVCFCVSVALCLCLCLRLCLKLDTQQKKSNDPGEVLQGAPERGEQGLAAAYVQVYNVRIPALLARTGCGSGPTPGRWSMAWRMTTPS